MKRTRTGRRNSFGTAATAGPKISITSSTSVSRPTCISINSIPNVQDVFPAERGQRRRDRRPERQHAIVERVDVVVVAAAVQDGGFGARRCFFRAPLVVGGFEFVDLRAEPVALPLGVAPARVRRPGTGLGLARVRFVAVALVRLAALSVRDPLALLSYAPQLVLEAREALVRLGGLRPGVRKLRRELRAALAH